MGRCRICQNESRLVSSKLGVCLPCLRQRREEAIRRGMEVHRESRLAFGLPPEVPQDPRGVRCHLCGNGCRIPEGATGYCGLRRNQAGSLIGVSTAEAKVSWYQDPLPTNCVADWVCPGGSGVGYPRFAHRPGPERGYYNLAVFFHACSYNCLFCQNWHFRLETARPHTVPVDRLLSDLHPTTSCICFFGGDPGPQLPFALRLSRLALEARKDRILRICWETNGCLDPSHLEELIQTSSLSGGCIKFDLKAWNEDLHLLLTGSSNRRTLENFRKVAEWLPRRPTPPLLIASTLLVPGYIDEEEVRGIARFIASLSPDIPYRLLAFHPHFYLDDLPLTSRELALRCLRAAREEGLREVTLGNQHLLR